MGVGVEFGEDALAFFLFDVFHFGVAELLGGFFVGDFDELDLGVGAEAFRVFGDSLL